MVKKWKKNRILLSIVIIIILSSSGPVEVNQAYQGITSDVIEEKQEEISRAEQEKNDLQAGLTEVQNLVKELASSKLSLDAYILQLDESLIIIQQKLDELKTSIEKKEKEIEIALDELEIAEEIQHEQNETMKDRIKFIYEKGDTMYLEMLLSAQDFSDLLNKSDYIQQLAAYDTKMLEEYMEVTATIIALKEMLLEEEAVLQVTKEAVDHEEMAMDTLIANKNQEITNIKTDISNKEQAIREYENNIASQTAMIEELEAIVEAEKLRIAKENGLLSHYDGGQFGWPLPVNFGTGDEYGMRMHPILGIERMHNGIDFPAGGGTPIYAAYRGTVVSAAYSNSMGNYIMIDHGDNLYTIYMHASVLNVSSGEEVAKGKKIAEVGSTGLSTGNHLHFGVRLNGSYVDPRNYFN